MTKCGFNPFDDARAKFDVRFYIVAILFIVFDLEIIFHPCPWSLVLRKIDSAGFWGMMFFLVILTIGFVLWVDEKDAYGLIVDTP